MPNQGKQESAARQAIPLVRRISPLFARELAWSPLTTPLGMRRRAGQVRWSYARARAMSSGVSSRLSRVEFVGAIPSLGMLPDNTSHADRASWVRQLPFSVFRKVRSVFITAALWCEPKRSGGSRVAFESLMQRICQTKGRKLRAATSRDRGLASAASRGWSAIVVLPAWRLTERTARHRPSALADEGPR